MSDFEFRAKDKVKCAFFGDEVFELEEIGSSLKLKGSSNMELNFSKFGKVMTHHTHPVLTLVERPKRMVKKQVEYWTNLFPIVGCLGLFKTEEEARDYAPTKITGRVATIKLTGTYEVEE